MSGDIPVETKKVETEAKPLLLTASASVDVYVQPEKTSEATATTSSGVSGFVRDYYAQPKPEANTDCTRRAQEAEAKFREELEKSSVKDLKNKVSVQSQMLAQLRAQLESCTDPVEKANRARQMSQTLLELKPQMAAIGQTVQRIRDEEAKQIQNGIASGKIDLSHTRAQLKCESDAGTFQIKSSKKTLTIESASGIASYSKRDGQIIERKNGVERVIGSSADSFVYNNGQLDKLPAGAAAVGPKIEFPGDKSLNTNITRGDSNITDQGTCRGLRVLDKNEANIIELTAIDKMAKDAQKDQPGPVCGGGNKGHDEGKGWPSDPFKPGSGRVESDYGRSAGADIYDRSTMPTQTAGYGREQIDIPQRQATRIVSGPNAPIQVESERISTVSSARVQGQDIAAIREITVPVMQRQNSVEAVAPVVPSIGALAQARMEQIYQPTASAQNVVGRLADISKLPVPHQVPAVPGQSAPVNYNSVFNSSANPIANSLSKQFLLPNQYTIPNQNQFPKLSTPNQFSVPNQFSTPSQFSIPNLAAFRSATTPAELSRNTNSSLNSFGKSLQDVKDAAIKTGMKNPASHFTASSVGSRLADLISDKTPGAHSTVTDKWTPVKGISGGGGASGSDLGPFIPISGKVGGAGSSTGARSEGVRGLGTKPDSKGTEGSAVHGGSNIADGGKKNEGTKSPEGVKSHGGSNAIHNTINQVEGTRVNTAIEGIKSGIASTANGGSNIADGGRKIDDVVAVAQGTYVGASIKDGKAVKNDKEEESRQGESEDAAQKDPGFGYTPRRSPYTVKRGETLESIARQRWGDERLAELIRTINLHRLSVVMEDGKAVLKLSAGDVLWLPSPIEAERFRKVCNIKGDGQHALTVGFSV